MLTIEYVRLAASSRLMSGDLLRAIATLVSSARLSPMTRDAQSMLFAQLFSPSPR